MAQIRKKTFVFGSVVIGIGLVALVYVSRPFYYGAKTIHELLVENRQLKEAITNLTAEDQIGYAKVISQDTNNGKLSTTLRFVETARDDKLKKIVEKECTIEGDIVHFDAFVEMPLRGINLYFLALKSFYALQFNDICGHKFSESNVIS
jgi:hypothetical protein